MNMGVVERPREADSYVRYLLRGLLYVSTGPGARDTELIKLCPAFVPGTLSEATAKKTDNSILQCNMSF